MEMACSISPVSAPCRILVRAPAARSLNGAGRFHLCGHGHARPLHVWFPLLTASKHLGLTVSPFLRRHSCESAHRSARATRRHGRAEGSHLSGEFTSPRGGVKPPLHQAAPRPPCVG